ncbi:hypothetical protein PInf_013629 [Phytophthora infestans]|nr:hypothetical protein PInf_013629 [Phytophthora infestans]
MSTTGQRDDQHRPPRGVDNSAEEMGEEIQAQEKEALLARPASRQKFAAVDDIVLVKAVNTFRPWTTAVGTSKGIMKVFDDIAIHCRFDKSFGLKKPGAAIRTRFTNLVTQYKTDQCQSMQGSGTVEEYAEREMLPQNIVALMNGWEDKGAQRKENQTAKQRGIERSGELLRSLAMGEIASEEADRQAGFSDGSQCEDSASESVKASISSCTVGAATPSKRTTRSSPASEDEKAKFQYKMQRLQFERE